MARKTVVMKDVNPIPQADCVEGFKHPRETSRLYGHENAERELANLVSQGTVHHGWLLSGPSGIGKATLAYRFAKYVFAKDEERDPQNGPLGVLDDCATASQIRAQAHPGLLVIRRPYDVKSKRFVATIPVDEVRRVRNFLTHRGGDGSWRVVIIDTADEMNLNAANAVLKSLEEPPRRAIFLLITSEPGRLLATIRSRCRLLQLSPLSSGDLETACHHAFDAARIKMPDNAALKKLLKLGRGRVGRVLSLYGMGSADVFDDVERVLAKAGKPDWAAIHSLGDKMAPASALERYNLFFELLLEQLSQLIRVRARAERSNLENTLASSLIEECTIPQWAALWEDISRSRNEVATLNLDRKAFFIETMHNLHALAIKRK